MIGFAHMHVNEVALYIHNEDNMELCAVSDTIPATPELSSSRYTRAWNINNVRENYCDNFYDDYKKMLDAEKPDIVFILTETVNKLEAVRECARRGINVCVEKPLAMNLEQALEIKRIRDESGIEIMVNWPLTWRAYLHTVKNVLDSGKVGKLLKLRFLLGHTGPLGVGASHRGVNASADILTDEEKASLWWYRKSEGGGALLDFCCYGCMLCDWYNDEKPRSVKAVGVNLAHGYTDIFDNGIAVVSYDSSVAVLEGTWSSLSKAVPPGPTLYCSEGAIECVREGNAVRVKVYDIYGNELECEEAKLGHEYDNGAAMYAHHIKTSKPIHPSLTLESNIRIMAMLDALVRSAESSDGCEAVRL